MHIEESVRKFLLDPILAGTLTIAVDEFILNTKEGPIQLSASLHADQFDKSFRLEVRDSQGRDLSQYFTRKNKITEEDTLSGSGVIGHTIRVEFEKIWPPTSSTIRPVGDVQTSSAVLSFSNLVLPPSSADSQTHEEIRELLHQLNPHRAQNPSNQNPQPVQHEQLAIFSKTKLMFTNCGTEWMERHPFWGEIRGVRGSTWEGSALGGTYSLRQAGDNLEVGFRSDGEDDEFARLKFDALLQAVAYTHAIFAWPSYLLYRRNGAILKQSFKLVRQNQGKMIPLRKSDGYLNSSAPANLIASTANYFFSLPQDKKDELIGTLWVFRGADSDQAPAPLQIAMICSVIEGLRAQLVQKQNPPKEFTECKEEALAWVNTLANDSGNEERASAIRRLKVMIGNWNHQDRRVEWNDAFQRLFPGRESWVKEMYDLFQKNRHGPAHGQYGGIAKGDPHDAVDAIGRLAGFVNIIIAAMAGYQGTMLESPFADQRIDIGDGDIP